MLMQCLIRIFPNYSLARTTNRLMDASFNKTGDGAFPTGCSLEWLILSESGPLVLSNCLPVHIIIILVRKSSSYVCNAADV